MGYLFERMHIRGRYLLVAPLIFSLLCFVQLPEANTLSIVSLDSPLYFLLAYLIAGLVTCMTFFCVPMLRTMSYLHILALVCALPIIAGIGLTFSFSVAGFGSSAQIPGGAALIGFGSALLLLMWAQAFALLDRRYLVPTIAAAFSLAFLLKLLFSLIATSPFNLPIIGAAILASALPLDGRTMGSEAYEHTLDARRESIVSGSLVILQWWKPFFGCVLCCMIWGFSWGNSLAGAPPSGMDPFNFMLTDMGRLTASILLLALSMKQAIDPGTGFMLPSAVGLLLLGWIFSMVEGFTGQVVAGFTSGIGFALFQVALWIKTCEIAGRSPSRARALFALSHAILAAVILIGIASAAYIGARGGELITPICSIVFFVLLATVPTTADSTKHPSPRDDPAPFVSEHGSGSDIEAICAACGLSPRETEVFALFVRGHSAKFISEQLVVSLHTVKTHVKRIYEKLGVHSKDELIAFFDSYPDNRR